MKAFFAVVLIVIFILAFRARWKQPNRMVRALQLIRGGNEARRISTPVSTARATPRLPAPAQQSRSSGGIFAPFLNPDNHRQPVARVRHTCACPERGPRDLSRMHANVICISCRGSLSAKLAG